MNYEIRTMSFGELLDTGFRLVRNHFLVLLGIGLILFLPFELVQSFFLRGPHPAQPGSSGFALGIFFLVVFIALVAPLAAGAATRALGEAFLGREPAIGDAYRFVLGEFTRLLGTAFLYSIFVILGLLLLVIPGIYLSLAFLVTYQVVILEGFAGMNALKRSRELMAGSMLRALGIVLVAMILMLIFSTVLQIAIGFLPYGNAIGSALVDSVVFAYSTAVSVLLYFDVRCRKESFDLEHLARQVEAGGPAPAPSPS